MLPQPYLPAELPYLTEKIPAISGVLRQNLEDFEVEEVPLYPPEEKGEHTLILIEKRDLTTPYAVRQLCEISGSDPKQAGWAGLKDRHGVTRQWLSLFGADPETLRTVQRPDLRVLEAHRHPHKLRPGHLRANRFTLRIRGVSPERHDDALQVWERLKRDGVPNYFGEQRFGRAQDNAEQAWRWIAGDARAPRGRFDRKFQVSAFQSALFNHYVAARLEHGGLARALEGDLMQRFGRGGPFLIDGLDEAQSRIDAGEISPTGPMFGAKMRAPERKAAELENDLLARAGVTSEHLGRMGRVGQGTRRRILARLEDPEFHMADQTLELHFTLPPGSYATVVAREFLKQDAQTPDQR